MIPANTSSTCTYCIKVSIWTSGYRSKKLTYFNGKFSQFEIRTCLKSTVNKHIYVHANIIEKSNKKI